MRAFLTFRLAALVAFVASAGAQAATATINGVTIKADAPAGYCELSDGHPRDAELLTQTRQMLRGNNHLVLSFVKCDEVADFRKGRRDKLDNFGQVMVPMPKGQFQRIYAARPAFVASLDASAKKIGSDTMKQVDAKLRAASGGELSVNQNLGVLGTDDSAIYFAVLTNAPAEDGSRRVLLGVSGMTVIKQLPVTINLYEVKGPSSTASRMLSLQQKNLANLIAANP